MEIEIGREYNIQSLHRRDNDDSYIFRGIVESKDVFEEKYDVRITEFNVSKGQQPGDMLRVYRNRFKSLVARTNIEAKRLLQEEY
jgi:D-lyxose ketol-isomerase